MGSFFLLFALFFSAAAAAPYSADVSSTELALLDPCATVGPHNLHAALLSGLLAKYDFMDKYNAATSKGKNTKKNYEHFFRV